MSNDTVKAGLCSAKEYRSSACFIEYIIDFPEWSHSIQLLYILSPSITQPLFFNSAVILLNRGGPFQVDIVHLSLISWTAGVHYICL